MSTVVETPIHESPAAPARQPSSALTRAVDLFFSPGKLFEELREAPGGAWKAWLAPIAIAVVVAVGLTLLRPVFMTDREYAQATIDFMRQNGGQAPMTVDQMEAALSWQQWLGVVMTAIMSFIRIGLMGGVLFVLFGAVLGGSATFRQYASVVSWASLVPLLGVTVTLVLIFMSGDLGTAIDSTFLMERPEGRSLAYAALRAITPFMVWYVALLALGGATVNRRKGWMGPALAIFALLLVFQTAFGYMMPGAG
jgi:Yip1 domain